VARAKLGRMTELARDFASLPSTLAIPLWRDLPVPPVVICSSAKHTGKHFVLSQCHPSVKKEKIMDIKQVISEARGLYDIVALYEEPMGVYYTDTPPAECISPKPAKLPTREQEQRGEVNFGEIFGMFSCIFQSVWRARRKKTAACFDPEHFGCLGGAFCLGYIKPQLEAIVHYVSTGFGDQMPGEHYLDSPEAVRAMFDALDPRPAPAKYCVFKPLSMFETDEQPELVVFFDRPDVIAGLHQLCAYVTNDLEVVRSPMGAGCYGAVGWPIKYLEQGKLKAVLGAWDPACRKFFRTDEITFTVPTELFRMMVERWRESFLTHKGSGWEETRKRTLRSRRKWGEKEPGWLSQQE